MAEGDVTVQAGLNVAIEIRNIGWVNGQVAWVQGNRFGVMLEVEIDPRKARTQI